MQEVRDTLSTIIVIIEIIWKLLVLRAIIIALESIKFWLHFNRKYALETNKMINFANIICIYICKMTPKRNAL